MLRMHFGILTFLSVFLLVMIGQSHAAGILSPNDAVVTGHSHSVDLNQPSISVISLPHSEPFGTFTPSIHFTVKAKEVGQVFGVALDSAAIPNIYVAATSAYGLSIYQPGKGNLQQGKPGAQYTTGLFGPTEQGGGATSIWKIDGSTGAVSLFANVIYNGIENTPASLGGLAFDSSSQQLFVADRTTGMIHRFTLDGKDQGVYDHGVEGLSAAGQSTHPFDANTLVNIKEANFDPANPNTWGFAPIERRVYALAIYQNRLFYSVSATQVWSVGIVSGAFAHDARLEINSASALANIEISAIAFDQNGFMYIAERGFTPADQNKNRVLRFAPKKEGGWNSSPEEYAIGMQPDYQHTNGGVDLSCEPYVWSTANHLQHADEGLQGNAVNLVKPNNVPPQKSWFVKLDNFPGAIAIWKVCNNKVSSVQIAAQEVSQQNIQEEYAAIPPMHEPGCPGFCSSFPGFNCPECCFWLEPWGPWGMGCPWGCGPWGAGPGWGGIWDAGPWGPGWGSPWGVGPWGVGPWWGGIWVAGPWGMGPGWGPWGMDLWILDPWCYSWLDPWFHSCDFCLPCILLPFHWCPGFLMDGHCFSPIWPLAVIKENVKKQTAPASPCKSNEKLVNGKCITPPAVSCKPNQDLVDGKCVTSPATTCQPGERLINGKCVTPPTIICKTTERLVNGECIPLPTITCKPNERLVNGKCVPEVICKPGERLVRGKCIPTSICKPGERFIQGECVPTIVCKPGERLIDGECVPMIICKPGERLVHGQCVPKVICKPGERLVQGRCVPAPVCEPGERLINGRCVPTVICKPGERLLNGKCIPTVCKPWERLVNGKCVPSVTPPICKTGERLVHGKCVPAQTTVCKPWQRLINGNCVTVTQPPNQPPAKLR